MRPQMKACATALCVMMTFAGSASGQTLLIGPENRETAFGTDPVIHITSQFRTAVALKEGQVLAEGTTLETARRELYQMAENECQTLSQIYKAECRLSSVTIAGAFPNPNQPPQNTVSASATYQLRTRSSR